VQNVSGATVMLLGPRSPVTSELELTPLNQYRNVWRASVEKDPSERLVKGMPWTSTGQTGRCGPDAR
jgi:hypothetical protein